jgi:protein-arginine kinase activator protein McsA
LSPVRSEPAAEKASERVCRLCGRSLKDRRKDARFCSPSHRTEANRIQAILGGKSNGPYESLAARLKSLREPFVRF